MTALAARGTQLHTVRMGVSRNRLSAGILKHRISRLLLCMPAAILAALLFAAAPVRADEVRDSQSPEFAQAMSLWLDANEAYALPAFAELAAQGNTAAQILLGLIDKTAALQGPYLTNLARAERIALLRQPGGLSGRSWMHAAARSSPRAALWLDLWQLQGGTEIAQGFAALDEQRACREALLAQVSRQESGFDSELLAEPWFPDSLRHLTTARALALDEAEALPRGHPLRQFAGESLAPDDLRDWLSDAPLALPLRAACAAECGESTDMCTLALYKALGSYHTLAMIGSPSVVLVPEESFATSPRGRQAVARRIMLMHSARMRDITYARLSEIDICAAEWLRAEYRSYHPGLRPSPPVPD